MAGPRQVTLNIPIAGGGSKAVDMPGATTVKYATVRVAEAVGYDPDQEEFRLFDPIAGTLLAESDIVEPWDGKRLLLTMVRPI